MKRAKMILKKLIHPPKWALFFIPAVSFAALSFIFAAKKTESALAYPIYSMSAYSLVILSAAVPALAAKTKAAIWNSGPMRKITSTEFGGKYLNDLTFRGGISIYQGMAVNFLYVIFRRLGSPLLSAAKALNFVYAMMSVLGLQTAMIARFSQNGDDYRKMMNAITGGFVWGIVILTAVYMLLHSKKLGEKVEPYESL